MSVEMNKIKCMLKDRCKYADGCIVIVSIKDGGTFTPVLKLRQESLELKLKCFSFVEKPRKEAENDRKLFPL